MLITVHCPSCRTKLHLQAELRGKKTRCPNTVCKEIFEVREDGETSADPPPPKEADVIFSKELPARRREMTVEVKQSSGQVGDLVPLVSSEAVEEATPARRDEPGGSPGAPVSGSVEDIVPILPAEEVEKPAETLPGHRKTTIGGPEAKLIDVTPWQTEPPPVRKGSTLPEASINLAPEAARPAEDAAWQAVPPPVRKKPPEAPARRDEPAGSPPPRKAPETKAPTVPASRRVHPAGPPQGAAAPVVTPPVAPASPGEPPTPHRRDEPAGSPAWHSAPPPVRQKDEARKPAPTATMSAPAFDWSAAGMSAAVPTPVTTAPPPPAKGRGTWWIIGILLAAIAGGAFAIVQLQPGTQTEDDIWKQAQSAKEERKWREASALFKKFADNFPDSPRTAEARFLEAYMKVKEQVHLLGMAPEAGLEALKAFLGQQQANPVLENYQQSDVRDDFLALARKFLQRAEPKAPVKQHLREVKPDLAQADEMIREARNRLPGDDIPADLAEKRARLAKEVEQADLVVVIVQRLQNTEPTLRNIQEAKDAIRQKDPELLKEAEVRDALQDLEAQAVKHVRYTVLNRPPKPGRPPQEVAEARLTVPRLDREEKKTAPFSGRVVFALARGVLYALDEADGHVEWATRVGIDTTQLPVRLRPTETDKDEIVLVLSSDSNTLCARNVRDGAARWHIDLDQPCLGRPLVVQDAEQRIHRVYLPLFDGRILEIETATGILLGEYQLGTPLTVGGAQQKGSSLLYFPGDKSYVYVLDFAKRQCVAILNSDHPSGSLRSEPIIVADPDRPALPRYLILSQSEGLGAMKLRAFTLPIQTNATVLKEESLRGWSWFTPYCDGEKIVLATDAGVLGLVGINQYRNNDPPLFPILTQPPGNETAIGFPKLQGEAKDLGRAVIVHATENDFWALGLGCLQHWGMGFAPSGLLAGPVWREPLKVGTPLHAGQVSGNKLVVVTRAPDGAACLATAADAGTGQVLWQRQLGVVADGGPVALGGRVLLQDQSGSLFLFDGDSPGKRLAGPAGGADAIIMSDAAGVVVLRSSGDKLRLRRVIAGQDAKDLIVQESTFDGTAAGTPALGPDYLVLPLADGSLLRQPFKGDKGDFGPDWRTAQADPGSRGYVVSLGNHDFVFTNGSRGLRRLSWPQPMKWQAGKPIDLPDRIVAAPLALPRDEAEPMPRLCVAEASGTLRLLRLQPDRHEEVHLWSLGEPVSAGPFLLAGRIGCVIAGRRLVLLEPGRAEPLWSYAPAEGQIVGIPKLIGDVLVVADTSGRIVGLDAATGQPKGKGYQLRSSAAPSSAPVLFGKDQVFAPLTDGTILVLPLPALVNP